MSEAYNGWTNYQTWLVALCIDNEQGSYNRRQEMAIAAASASKDSSDSAEYILATQLKEWISEEDNPLVDSTSVYSDLLSSALEEVNWREIANNFLSDIENE